MREKFGLPVFKRDHLWSLLVVVLVLLAAGFSWFERADHAVLDYEFRLLRQYAPLAIEKDVLVVGIDEETFSAFQEPFALWHPHLGAFFQAMAVAKPSVLGLDVVLPDRSMQPVAAGYDQQLLQGLLALKTSQVPVILGQSLNNEGVPHSIFSPYVAVAGSGSRASVAICIDSDGLVRMAGGTLCDGQQVAETLSGKMAAQLGAPSGQHGLINYRLGSQFVYVPLTQVLDWLKSQDVDKLRAVFAGRPVLLGITTQFDDRLRVPVALAGWEPLSRRVPGVLVHAQSLRSMLSGGLLHPVHLSIVVLFCTLASFLWRGRSSWVKLAVVLAFLVCVMSGGLLLLGSREYMPVASVMLSGVFAALARLMLDGWNYAQERRKLKRSFDGYVSPQVMEEILAGRLSWESGGELRRVCIMFADVRGFTTLSETMKPQEVLALMNRYFEEVTLAIHEQGGTINCFMGDGVMAIFGAPNTLINPTVSAFTAARNMLNLMPTLNARLQSDGIAPLSIGIGLNVGDAVIGYVGSRLRHDYSAIGDTTNVASRLEGLTKETGCPLVCSGAVLDELQTTEGSVDLGVYTIKGHTPMHVYGWRELPCKM